MKVFKLSRVVFVDINKIAPEEISSIELESCADALNIPSYGYRCDDCVFSSLCVDHWWLVCIPVETLKRSVSV